jgi:5-methylcytosine-specific restriction endonuclease McrA
MPHDNPDFKFCKRGQHWVHIDDFGINNATKSGRHYTCKDCVSKSALKTYYKYHDEEKERLKQERFRRENYARSREIIVNSIRRTGREKVNASIRRWQNRNPAKLRLQRELRRARLMNAEGTYKQEDIDRLYDEQNGRCLYCGIRIFFEIKRDVCVDHIIPLSRGGSNWPDNLALACQQCNGSKANKTIAEWELARGW